MSGKRNQRLRVLKLLHILSQKADEAHPLNANELIEELERYGITCDRKTIYEDIDALCLSDYDIINKRTRNNSKEILVNATFKRRKLT